jgi:hypothetical protein
LSLATTVGLGCAGCVERTIRITSEPAGALVWLNDVEIGRTPVETDFDFYGTYDVRLKLEGYETVWEGKKANAPIYDWPVIDLVSEALPVRLRSRFQWHFDLQPVARVEGAEEGPSAPEAELLRRARVMRAQTGVEVK